MVLQIFKRIHLFVPVYNIYINLNYDKFYPSGNYSDPLRGDSLNLKLFAFDLGACILDCGGLVNGQQDSYGDSFVGGNGIGKLGEWK